MSIAHADAAREGTHVLFVKGAPDVLLTRCTAERVGSHEAALTDGRRRAIAGQIDGLAGDALRTLGLAYRRLPTAAHEALHLRHEDELVWLGVVGMIDPPRPEAAGAVAAARRAGLRVLMITGDHPAAAGAIAAELGIAPRGGRGDDGRHACGTGWRRSRGRRPQHVRLRARGARAQARDRARTAVATARWSR